VAARPTTSPSKPKKGDAESELVAFEAAFDDFFAAVRRARGRAARETGPGELTLAQYQLLAGFNGEDELPVGELAEAGGVAPPTATRMLDGLERDDIVERSHSTEDRRRVTVRLTDHGSRMLKRKRQRIKAKRREVFASLKPAEREGAERMLKRLAEVIDHL
jgi:DNA-binding MarR family transcriptional regulator